MQVDFSELDYSRIFLNPMEVPVKKDPSQHYKDWVEWPEFLVDTPEINKSKLFRYIPLVYGKNTPLNDVFKTLEKVKAKAAELAGFVKVEGRYNSEVEAVLTCKNRDVNAMIMRYITLHRQSKYDEFCVFKQVHFNLSISLLEDSAKKDIESFSATSAKLDEIALELTNNDKVIKEQMHSFYLDDRIRLRPEDIAFARKKLTK